MLPTVQPCPTTVVLVLAVEFVVSVRLLFTRGDGARFPTCPIDDITVIAMTRLYITRNNKRRLFGRSPLGLVVVASMSQMHQLARKL